MSLPSPLIASDEWVKPRDNSIELVRVTAGLHRQVWVSGTSIYVDVHIVNNSRKVIKKIELQLERDILCYKHVCCAMYSRTDLKMLMSVLCRLPHLLLRNLQVKRESLTATKDPYSANQSSKTEHPVGMVFQLIRLTSVHVILKCLADMLLLSVVGPDCPVPVFLSSITDNVRKIL
jgi:hypothetical protein